MSIERIQRIRASLEKINQLMYDLREPQTDTEGKDDSNVVSLDAARQRKAPEDPAPATSDDLATIEAKNKANEERLRRERANNNKSVLRSYRIKN